MPPILRRALRLLILHEPSGHLIVATVALPPAESRRRDFPRRMDGGSGLVLPAPWTIDRLDNDALLQMHDLLPALTPASAIDDADGDMLSIHDLGDAELDTLHGLLDDRS